NLDGILDWLDEIIAQSPPAASATSPLPKRLDSRRGAFTPDFRNDTPWRAGYIVAREARRELALPDKPSQWEDWWGGRLPVSVVPQAPSTIDGLVVLDGMPHCFTGKKHPRSQRFLAARALADYVVVKDHRSLLTTA